MTQTLSPVAEKADARPKRSLRKRLAILLAAIAVPAMAAPNSFVRDIGVMPGAAPSEAASVNARLAQQMADNPPMEFERPGMSFPGSAFYFLADPPSDALTNALIALPTRDARRPGGEAGRTLGELIDAGPAARPFFSAAGQSHMRAQQCLAQAIWYEAASESEAGQRAVAQVVLNRVAHPSWPDSVCGVVYEGSQRSTGCQFTFTCDGSLSLRAAGTSWMRARSIAGEALSGSVYAPIGHATHYHTLWVDPYWASSLDHVATIGAHRFYRSRGTAGSSQAFNERYDGVEQLTGSDPKAPHRITALVSLTQDDAVTGAYADPVENQPREPLEVNPAFSGTGQVRDTYANAGRWKDDAARAALEEEKRALAIEQANQISQPPR